MQALTIKLKYILTFILLSTLAVNSAMAKSDRQLQEDALKARELLQKHGKHFKHIKPVDEKQKYRGVFYGYLPCKDCDGIKTTLSLKNKNNYLLVTQYAKTSTREFFEKGKYSWDDKTRTVTLISRKDSSVRKYHIKDEGSLILLSNDGKPMKYNRDKYTLLRSDINKSRAVHIH